MSVGALIFWSFVTGLLGALATGLGALPVALMRNRSTAVKAFCSAAAGGMMIAASMVSLVQKGMTLWPTAPYEVMAGLLGGTLFFWLVETRLHTEENMPGRRGWLIFVAMLIHSIPEGMAVGVGFATGDLAFGLVMSLAIAFHNIPEGVAISLAMSADGASVGKCAWYSVLSSMPQPIMAVPAALAAWMFQPLLPFALGFAAGAMTYLTVTELIPEALEEGSPALTGWGVMLGITTMLGVITVLEKMPLAGM